MSDYEFHRIAIHTHTIDVSDSVEEITEKLNKTGIDDGQSSSTSRTERIFIPSNSRDGNGRPAANMRPVAKRDLPYMSQSFVERSKPTVEESRMCRVFNVETNFFPLIFDKEIRVYQYDIQYKNQKGAEIKRAEFTNKAFWYAYRRSFEVGQKIFPPYDYLAYNGVNILWSIEKLNFRGGECFLRFSCDDVKVYSMLIKYTGMVALKPNPQSVADQMNLVTVLDEVLTSRLTCLYEDISHSFHKFGKSLFFTPKDPRMRSPVVALGGGLEAWTGLHGAIKPNLQAGLLLNVDLSHSIFYKQGMNLVHFYCEILNNVPYDADDEKNQTVLAKSGLNEQQRSRLAEALKGRTLEYRRPKFGGIKIFKFSQIASKAAEAHFFKDKQSGRTSTIEEYYEKNGYKLNYPYLPCICINKTKNLWAPMELIWTDNVVHKLRGKIPDRQLRTLVQKTAHNPLEKKNILLTMAASQGRNDRHPIYLAEQDQYMRNFGTRVDRNLLRVKASLLSSPTLEFGEGINFTDDGNAGIWELQNGSTLKKIKSERLTIIPCLIFLQPESDTIDYKIDVKPLGILMEVLHNFGVNTPGGTEAFVVDRFDCYKTEWSVIKTWMEGFKAEVTKRFGENAIPLALYVFPYKCTTRRQKPNDRHEYFSEYSMVKYLCDVVTGVHCQGILQQTYSSMAGNFLTCLTAHNVAIKILGKIGATLYTIRNNPNEVDEAWAKLTNPEEPTLILGIDVTHPGELDRREGKFAAYSVACVVGNVDIMCMQYEANVRAQEAGQERTLYIKDEISKRIQAFETKTGKRPAHIVVYRDGVSETQFQETLYEEKLAIKDAVKDISHNYQPTLSYLIVSKRHHTRFFPLSEDDTTGKAMNLKPGTLVESSITTKNYFDFYLISQHGPVGTSRPTHYYVLWDEWAPSSTFWQLITNYLTYGYIRCPKSISQPAPVMYAHLAAKRAKDYLMAYLNYKGEELVGKTSYEVSLILKKHMEKNSDLQGMVFV